MTQYALVPKAEPVIVVDHPGDETLNCRNDDSAPTDPPRDRSCMTSQLLDLYEAYAETYPNPALQEENQERDRLLRAISAANHAVSVNPKKEPKQSSWWNFFGNTNSAKASRTTTSFIDEVENDDDRLVYTDIADEDQDYDSEFLLGTGFSLDPTCIPPEVHSLARHYLCRNRKSSATTKKNQTAPKVARTYWETAGTSCIVITGLGQMVEFRKRASSGRNENAAPNDHTYTSSGNEVYTSDRTQLLEYYSTRQRQEKQLRGGKVFAMTQWHPSHADAALVGPNFLIVHWGLDSRVTFYRRVTLPPDTINADASRYSVTWEAVAVCGATALVREALADMFAEGGDDADSELIHVTAVHPLVVEIPQHAPIVTLAVARLGGFIELIPLPPQMWYGSELPFSKKHVQPHISNRGTKRNKGDSLKSGRITVRHNLPDLAANAIGGGGIIVLNTSDYHSDVLGLESFALSSDINKAWNQSLYPDGPPAQLVLAAYGAKAETGRQAISFWSYTTNISPTSPGGVGFSIHSTIVEAIDLGKAGPDVTFFASPTIFRHWRKPRLVKLRDSNAEGKKCQRITTMSLAVPIVQISFVSLDVKHNDSGSNIDVCAAVLDWNGGVTLLDCTLLVRTAAQTLTEKEHAILFGEDIQNELQSLVHVMTNRTRITRSILKVIKSESAPVCISYIKCFQMPTVGTTGVMIAALTSENLYFVCSTRSTTDDSLSFEATTVSCSKLGIGQFLMSSKRHFIMNLVFQANRSTIARKSDSTIAITFCAVQKLKPCDVIGSLIRSNRFKDAIIAAENLPSVERDSVEILLEDCKKALWEAEFNVSVLDSIRDDAYVIDMACRPPTQKTEAASHKVFLQDNVELYKSVCQLALKRIWSARSWRSLSFADNAIDIKARLVKLGTYTLLCDHQSTDPSLRHFLNEFNGISMIDFALNRAAKADIPTLSLLWFRHRDELHSDHFRLVNAIPVSTSPIVYQHLLPIAHSANMGSNSPELFIVGSCLEDVSSVSEMPEYINYNFRRCIILGEDDEAFIREQDERISKDASSVHQYNLVTTADWYLHRTHAIQKFTTSPVCVATFAQLGLNAIQIRNVDVLEGKTNLAPSVVSLLQAVQFSKLQSTIPLDDKNLFQIGLKNFDTCDISDIVTLTFRCVDDSLDFQTRYNNYLLPMTKYKKAGCEEKEIFLILDDAIEKLCSNDLAGYECHDATDLIDMLTIYSSIIHSSRASLSKSSRIIKDSSTVVRLVANVVEKIVRNSSVLHLTQQDKQYVVDGLWKIYESLPVLLPSSIDFNDEIKTTINCIGKGLTFLDIVAGWPNTDAFAMMLRYLKALDTIDFLSDGEETIALLCRSFISQVEDNRSDTVLSRRTPSLLSALLSDCNELNTNCFKGKLQISTLFTKHIAKPLVRQRNAGLLGVYLSQAGHNLIESKAISDEVLMSFNEAIHVVSVGQNRETHMTSEIEFQNVLREWLPAVYDEMQPIQRCLDAENFIVNSLLSDRSESILLEQIQSMRALDVVEYVLKMNPWVVVHNCPDWKNPLWARTRNEMVRLRNEDKSNDLSFQPIESTLPGEAIFHLAQLLGLTDMPSVIVVKSRVVYFALTLNLDDAAAFVTRTLIIDSAALNVGTDVALHAVAKIVAREEFEDISTKHELCASAQRLLSTKIQVNSLVSYELISTSWNRLQHRNILWNHDMCCSYLSFGHFYSDSMLVSKESIVDHASLLTCHFTKSLMSDAMIVALARHALIRCIEQTTKAKVHKVDSLQSRGTDVLATFAAALLLHVRDNQFSLHCLTEVKTAFDKQLGHASSTGTRSSPNHVIVKNLIGRGYSENGARRSAVAVNNQSFHVALQWAVAHSLDIGFDDPYIFLQQPAEESNIDIDNAEFLKRTIDKLMTAIANERLNVESKCDQDVGTASTADKFYGNIASMQFQETEVEENRSQGIESLCPNQGSLENDDELLGKSDRCGSTDESTRMESTIVARSIERPLSSIKDQIAVDVNRATSSTWNYTVQTSPSSAPDVVFSNKRPTVVVAIPKSNESSPDRSMLYQVGQEAFVSAQQRRRPSSSTTSAERLRLIEEGRRLLQQAKSGLSSASQQNGSFVRSVPTTPLSMFFNKESVQPASVVTSDAHTAPKNTSEPKTMTEKPPDRISDEANGDDEWDFDDENFDDV